MRFASDIDDLVYHSYLDIDHNAYQDRIRYFEKNKQPIESLSFEMRLELSLDYVNALFEVGDYYAFLRHVDSLLEVVLIENIYDLNGADIYQELLFRKASAYYNIVDYSRAKHVYSELVRIDPENDLYRIAYLRNHTDQARYNGQKTRGLVIGLFMLTGVIIGIELLAIRPFYSELTQLFETFRNATFGIGVTLLVLKELSIRLQARNRFQSIINKRR